MFKILSIDGGGIRGVIPGVLLHYIETQVGKSIAECFDLIAGTSTGGILAAGLTVPKGSTGNKKPKFSALDVLKLYTDHGREIFERSFWDGITSLGGALEERYDHAPLVKLLKRFLGNATLADCITDIIVTSYDIERRGPYFFKSRHARDATKDRNHYLRDVARATSAAPTYFEPAEVKTLGQITTRRALVDGGVFANNPAMCALVESRKYVKEGDALLLVSLGTGVATRAIPYAEAKDWGALKWVRPVIGVMMDGVADAVDYQLCTLLADRNQGDKQRYFRFDTVLDLALDDMDAANAANIQALKDEASQIIDENGDELARMVDLLKS